MITVLLALLAPAMAEAESKLKIEPIVDAWVAYDKTSTFDVDAEGTQGGQGGHLDTRQRLGVNFVSGDVTIGVCAGTDTSTITTSNVLACGGIQKDLLFFVVQPKIFHHTF